MINNLLSIGIMKKFYRVYFLFIVFILTNNNAVYASNEEALYLNITVNTSKMLEPKNHDGSQKMFEPAKYDPAVIVLHYTVTSSVGQTVNTFYNRGVSSHFTIDRDGTIYHHINDDNLAYHAGQSYWEGNYSVNYYSKGIEQINVGFDVDGILLVNATKTKIADGKTWETWSDKQVSAVANLVKALTIRYNIKPWNIIGHADIAPGRKQDPGPLFPWKKLHDEYGIGFWPDDDRPISLDKASELDHKDCMIFLGALGYATKGFSESIENLADLDDKRKEMMFQMDKALNDKDIITTFQYHYMQDRFVDDISYQAGKLDNDTKLTILKCVNSRINNDKYLTGVLNKLYANNGLSEKSKLLIKELGFIPETETKAEL
jgi:N-acetyl-anhydromuramyl-L-alanine amidase AmpD